MPTPLSRMLLAAKHSEIAELRRLAARAQLVGVAGHLVHALQNERGASSIYLASGGRRFAAPRRQAIGESRAMEDRVRAALEASLAAPEPGSARQLSRMAWVLVGLDALPGLRARIERQALRAEEAIGAYSRLMAGLIALVFEVADAAFEPSVSRRLVALLNFVQGKELAGQERALGALSFAGGVCSGEHRLRLAHLVEAQERCFQTFTEFADAPARAAWAALQDSPAAAKIERLRRTLDHTAAGAVLDAQLSDPWFEACSQRLADMWQLQTRLVSDLQAHCRQRIEEAERELQDVEGLIQQLLLHPPEGTLAVDRFFDPDNAHPAAPTAVDIGPRFAQSMVGLLQAQSDRLARMESELDAARRSLHERKVVERAKGLLMARLQLSEEAAYKLLRQTSMAQGRRLVEIAEATLALPGFIPSAPPA
jgi:hypothetical protein